ncbi:MAG: hypothetical protein IJ594_03315, partial [Oscillospiraceae bacterium]|nr:hypothetical protein [Oscillospiraceae bacterium]
AAADPVPAAMPVLRVRPRAITAAMARQMAQAVFGDAPLYEYSTEMSRDEIAQAITLWENALSDEAIRADHGEDLDQAYVDDVRQSRMEILDYYRNAWPLAREEVTPIPCQWRFWPDEHYVIHGHDYAGTDPSYTDAFPFGTSVTLRATATVDGAPFELWINNNETASFRNHSLRVFLLVRDELYGGDGDQAEREARQKAWYGAIGAYADAPATAEQLAACAERAERLAADMGLGAWRFTARVHDRSDLPYGGYQILAEGEPIYEGFPVSVQTQLSDMRSTAPGAQNLYYETLRVTCSNDGRLLDLDYCSPMEVVEVLDAAAPLLPQERADALALETMRAWTRESLIPGYSWWHDVRVRICTAQIDSVRVGYVRQKYDDTDFLLVPGVTFRGELSVRGTYGDAGPELDLYMPDEKEQTLLVLDLRDGRPLSFRNG